MEARNFTDLLANGATFDECLLVDLINFDEDLADLAQGETFFVKKRLHIIQEELFVELSEEEGKLGLAGILCMLKEAV